MVGHYERKWSFAARWCERVALLCVPYFGLTVLLHRFGQIDTLQAVWLLGVGLLMVAASLMLGVKALFDLWNRGYRGGKATIRGVVLSGIMLAPFIWYGYLAVKHPPLYDVATSPFAPPDYPGLEAMRERLGANPLTIYDEDYANLLVSAYPRVGSRRYEAGQERVQAAVEALLADRDWVVTPRAEAQAVDGETAEPASSSIAIHAVADSLIFGFESDVVIVVEAEAEATLVDMRSISRFGAHDFGANAAQIDAFLSDLDTALIGIAGEG